MAQIVINVNDTPTLFSPVLAHSLRRGDLISLGFGTARLTTPPRPVRRNQTDWLFVDGVADGEPTYFRFWPNEPVLRAVGANSGCGGSR